ncbi:MAG: 30S ribosomal protein S9 [Patescibacteria group bacterium]
MIVKKPIIKKIVKKTAPKKEAEVIVETLPMEDKKSAGEKYYKAVGRRKESIAQVRLYTKKATDLSAQAGLPSQTNAANEEKAIITVNGKDYIEYFTDANLWSIVESPLRKLKSINRFKATVVVRGGGKSGQAGAIKHGLARTLVEFDNNFRKKLKKSGYLTRDPRAKERRKYGLKKARKAPRWAKR